MTNQIKIQGTKSKVFVSICIIEFGLLRSFEVSKVYLRYLRYLSFHSSNPKPHPSKQRNSTLEVSVRSRNSFHSSSCSYLQELTCLGKSSIQHGWRFSKTTLKRKQIDFPKQPWKTKQMPYHAIPIPILDNVEFQKKMNQCHQLSLRKIWRHTMRSWTFAMSVLRDGINTRFPTTRWQGSLRSQLRPMGCEHRPLQDWWPQVYLAQARETWRYHVTEYLHTYTYTSFCRAISKSISYPHMILDHIYIYIHIFTVYARYARYAMFALCGQVHYLIMLHLSTLNFWSLHGFNHLQPSRKHRFQWRRVVAARHDLSCWSGQNPHKKNL